MVTVPDIPGHKVGGVRLPCTGPHVWQTFAIALLPTDAQTYDVNIVQAVASVRAVCAKSVLLRSRLGAARRIPRSNWTISVMPPDQAAFNSGARAYRCVAHKIRGAEVEHNARNNRMRAR